MKDVLIFLLSTCLIVVALAFTVVVVLYAVDFVCSFRRDRR